MTFSDANCPNAQKQQRISTSSDTVASLYDTLYVLAADKGRDRVLFGNCAPLAHEALVRSLIGDGFSFVWFEVPLMGDARFDLHVAYSRECLEAGGFFPGAGNGYDELFRWYAQDETGGGGLAFAYDVGEGIIDTPAVHVNVNQTPLDDVDRFFELAGCNDAAARYRAFSDRLPSGWHVWYMGVHPGRPGAPVRVDCFVEAERQKAYEADYGLLEKDLRSCGFTASLDALPELADALFTSPFKLELQFDVLEGGEVGPTLGLSAAFGMRPATQMKPLFDEGRPIAELMSRVEQLGLADTRWHAVRDAAYSLAMPTSGVGAMPLALYCLPTFLKLRMCEGRALDAKFYLQAAARNVIRQKEAVI